MRTCKLGSSTITTSALAYGCMRLPGTWNPSEVDATRIEQGVQALLTAYEVGYRLYDHADIYCRGECEKIHGHALRQHPHLRRGITIATKCGIRFADVPEAGMPKRFDFSAAHIEASCNQSLQRLGVEVIDIYQLHRPDFLMNPTEVAEAFARLHSAGKVRYFGVSNFAPSQVTLLQHFLPWPLLVNQVEIHLGKLDCFNDGTLDQCLTNNLIPLSWSPLAGGMLGTGGKIRPNHPQLELMQQLVAALDAMAERLGTTRSVLALAWLLKHPSNIVPIVGSVNPANIRTAAGALDLKLSREDWYTLLIAARGKQLP